MKSRLQNRLRNLNNRARGRKPVDIRPDRPIFTITFDDVLADATRTGLDILASHDIIGTWYVAPGLLGTRNEFGVFATSDDIRRLAAAGQDIAAHGFSHRRMADLSSEEILAEDQQCREVLRHLTGAADPIHFAFPEGSVTVTAKKLLGEHYATLRGIRPGIIRGRTDAALLSATALYGNHSKLSEVEQNLDQLHENGGWAIYYTHDVSENPSRYGATPELLAETLKMAVARDFQILSVAAAWDQLSTPAH